MDRREIAHTIRTMGSLLQIRGEDGFKVRAYQKAADSLLERDYDLATMAKEGRLLDIPGIGKNLEPKLRELIETGQSTYLERLVAQTPEGLLDLLRVPGIGPTTARLLHQHLGVGGFDDLREALKAGKLESLPGFGKKRQDTIAKGFAEIQRYAGRVSIATARPVLESIVERFAAEGQTALIVGEAGRYEETVRSLDVLATESAGEWPGAALIRHGVVTGMDEETLRGFWDPIAELFAFRTSFGAPLRIRFASKERFWARAVELLGPEKFAGSSGFLRMRALEKGYVWSEKGVFLDDRLVEIESEDEFFALCNLAWIPPEVRHRPELVLKALLDDGPRGLLDKASPYADLVSPQDLRGDLHVHTAWSDGTQSIEAMVQKARELGYSYIAITDHATSMKMINGLTPERVKDQIEEIAQVAEKYPDIQVLSGAEVDILRDGSLYLPDDTLKTLDVVVASLHDDIGDARGDVIERLTKAASHPHVDILGHPTGRLIGRRAGLQTGFEPVFRAAAQSGCALEINSSPERLDLGEDLVAEACSLGCTFAINTDAHSTREMENVKYGVYSCARRAGLLRTRVVNAWDKPFR